MSLYQSCYSQPAQPSYAYVEACHKPDTPSSSVAQQKLNERREEHPPRPWHAAASKPSNVFEALSKRGPPSEDKDTLHELRSNKKRIRSCEGTSLDQSCYPQRVQPSHTYGGKAMPKPTDRPPIPSTSPISSQSGKERPQILPTSRSRSPALSTPSRSSIKPKVLHDGVDEEHEYSSRKKHVRSCEEMSLYQSCYAVSVDT